MARTSTLSALDPRVLRRIPRLWLPMALIGALGLLLLHQRDRDRDRALAWERGAGVVRLQSSALEAELDGLASLTAQLARRDDVVRLIARGTPTDDERNAMLELLRLHDELSGLRVQSTAGEPLLSVEREGEPPPQLAFDTTAAEKGIVMPPLSTFVHDGKQRALLHAVGAIRASDGTVQGSFVSSGDGDGLVERLRRSSANAGACSLVNSEGSYLLGPFAGAAQAPPEGGRPPSGELARLPTAVRNSVHESERGQLLVDGGLYTWARVGRESAWSWAAAPGPTIVSFVSEAAIYAESSRTLRRLLLVAAVVGLLLLALAWRLAWADALRLLHLEGLAASQDRLQRLSQRLLEVQENERRSISRDLHDELGQLATAMTIDLKRAQRSEDAEQRSELVARARAGAERMLGSVRDLAARLRGSELEDLGLAGALESLCDELRAQGPSVHLTCRLETGEPEESVAGCLYRFTQEALTNVARHADAHNVEVDVSDEADSVRVRVRDDGGGFDVGAVPPGHLGLLGMRERVELAGGSFRLESVPGRGTLVGAVVPCAPDRPNPPRE